jgi:hypothetical protein
LGSNNFVQSSNSFSPPPYVTQGQQRNQANYEDYMKSMQYNNNRLKVEEDREHITIINSSQADPKLSGQFAYADENHIELEEKYQ